MDEFSLIKQFFSVTQRKNTDDGVILGIGDDTAIIKPVQGEELLFTTDTLISGVHFPESTSAEAVAYKALAVNLSDIAAMGGRARWFTLALSLPEADSTWLQDFANGLLKLAQQFDVCLVGGDTTRGALSMTISVIGSVPAGQAIRRSTAMPGEAIYITGQLGMAALGLASINGEISLSGKELSNCCNKLNYPEPRLPEGHFLRNYASSMIDISDGLAADLGHIVQASGCRAVIDSGKLNNGLPVFTELLQNRAIDAALYGGDDYELLFTVPACEVQKLEQSWPDSFSPLTQIGEVTEGEGIVLRDRNGDLIDVAARGYNHFNGK